MSCGFGILFGYSDTLSGVQIPKLVPCQSVFSYVTGLHVLYLLSDSCRPGLDIDLRFKASVKRRCNELFIEFNAIILNSRPISIGNQSSRQAVDSSSAKINDEITGVLDDELTVLMRLPVEGKPFYVFFFRRQKGAKNHADPYTELQITQTLEPSPKSRRPYSNWADNSMVVYYYRV